MNESRTHRMSHKTLSIIYGAHMKAFRLRRLWRQLPIVFHIYIHTQTYLGHIYTHTNRCECECECTCVYIYIHTQTYLGIYTHTQTYLGKKFQLFFLDMFVCVYICVCVCMWTGVGSGVSVSVSVRVCVCVRGVSARRNSSNSNLCAVAAIGWTPG